MTNTQKLDLAFKINFTSIYTSNLKNKYNLILLIYSSIKLNKARFPYFQKFEKSPNKIKILLILGISLLHQTYSELISILG